MRILLIQSYLGRKEPPVAPLGLAVIAANLAGQTVKIFDPNIQKDPLTASREIIYSFQPDLIGISLRNIDTTKYSDIFLYYKHFVKYLQFIACHSNGAVIAVGGSGFSLCPRQIMSDNPAIDYGFYLEADNSFPRFVECGLQPEGIRGIYFRKAGEVVHSGAAEPADDNVIPGPAWDLVDLKPYLPYQHLSSIGVESKRGCAQKCIYCTYPLLNGSNIRLRDPETVVHEIKKLAEEYRVQRIFFTDPVFNLPLNYAESICRMIIDSGLNISWSAYHHPEFFSKEYMELALDSGCSDFYFSPDAATDKGLKILGKSATVSGLNRCLDLIAANIRVKASFNFFAAYPEAGCEDYQAAKKFIAYAKSALKDRLTRYKFSFIRLEPGTPLAYLTCGKNVSPAFFLPKNMPSLRRLFYIKNKNRCLNFKLWLKFWLGILFGKRNVIP